MDTDRDVVFVADTAQDEEVGPARRFGGELEARARVLPWLWLDFDLSYTRARFKDADAVVPRAPRLLTAGGVQVRHPSGLFGSLRARHVGAFPLAEDGSRESQAYTVADLVFGYETKRFQVSLNVQNLFNTAWRDSEYYYESVANPVRETRPVADVHFRPGEPFLMMGNAKVFF
jgi:outer membrane receptor protein involved in Fe transport